MTNLTFSIIQVAQAHEEGAKSIAVDNALGPFLTLLIIILSLVVAKRIKRRR